MKKIASLCILLSSVCFAQEIKIEDDKVFLDGKEFLKYEKVSVINHSFFDLNGNEILHYKWLDNDTPSSNMDDYYVLNFINERKKVKSRDVAQIGSFFNSRKSCEKLIKWMLKDKVLNPDGTINPEKLDILYRKYNEDVENWD
ncbi:hypothetical protein [Flavobacterium sp.]|uniref:hypothetical protein n=1 Tax=Flavobacterium sp. TaxID=239 RepID=UPI0028BED7AC|nr:hypothetical protein [Flavobacterium sp.]